jgi:hypothetical protein
MASDPTNTGGVFRSPVPGRSYNQEDAIQELGMTADEASQFIATGRDPRTSSPTSQNLTTTFPDGSTTSKTLGLTDTPFDLGDFNINSLNSTSSLTSFLPDGSSTTSLLTDGGITTDPGALLNDNLSGGGDDVGTPSANDPPIVVTGHRIKDRPDHRVRLSAFRGQEQQVYGTQDQSANILAPLWETQGLMFPYTPTVAVAQDTTWNTADLEGVNYDILSFKTSASATLSVTGKFTVQNQREGRYLLAVLHFLRTVSKAYFGAQDVEKFVAPTTQTNDATPQADPSKQVSDVASGGRAGLPPPILLFSGYGNMMFNDVRVVVKSHSWSYDEAADLIRINLPAFDGVVWLPPMMTIQMTLGIQQNTDNVRNNFSLDDFRTGKLLKTKGWF